MDEQARSNIISGALAMPPVALLLGLWEVGWSFSALPMWFWPALLAVAVVGAASKKRSVYSYSLCSDFTVEDNCSIGSLITGCKRMVYGKLAHWPAPFALASAGA